MYPKNPYNNPAIWHLAQLFSITWQTITISLAEGSRLMGQPRNQGFISTHRHAHTTDGAPSSNCVYFDPFPQRERQQRWIGRAYTARS